MIRLLASFMCFYAVACFAATNTEIDVLYHDAKRIPKVYALRMNGTRAFEIPADLRDGRLMFDLDTSMFAVATPFFEIVNEK
jgi:hypothetical protein